SSAASEVYKRQGRVRVVLGDTGGGAYSVWFPGRGAWVVVPAVLLEDAEAFRLTVRHELQHHRQRDTVFAYARLGFDSAFFWNPFARAFSRWLADCQEFACDEALVTGPRVPAEAYARCLLQASLRVPGSSPLPAGVTGMSHPTVRRIHMLFEPRPRSSVRALGLVLSFSLVMTPLALWAQGAARGRAVSLAEARALAAAQPEGDLPVVVDAAVVEQLNRFVTTPKGRDFMRKALANLAVHREALAGTLRSKSLPEGLLAVAMVESAVSNLPETSGEPSLAPGQRGAGVWMFIPETARRYGLKVEAGRDERLDVARETEAAAALFQALHARYGGDWRLALAAYNQGEGVVDRVLAETKVRDVSELTRTGKLNGYTSTVQAAVLLLRNPHLLD
ncbi:tail length tape measure protein, partial [Corallococcus sp. CA047B]